MKTNARSDREPTPVTIVKPPPPIWRAPLIAAVAAVWVLSFIFVWSLLLPIALTIVALIALTYRPRRAA